MRKLLSALILLASLPAVAQERPCTMMGCMDGVRIELQASKWPAGKYDFTITQDGVATHCSGSLPLAGCDQPNIKCDHDGVMIEESGCALPPEGHSFPVINLSSVPKSVLINIKQQSGVSFHHSYTITPHCAYPNGKGCDAKPCCNASIETGMMW